MYAINLAFEISALSTRFTPPLALESYSVNPAANTCPLMSCTPTDNGEPQPTLTEKTYYKTFFREMLLLDNMQASCAKGIFLEVCQHACV